MTRQERIICREVRKRRAERLTLKYWPVMVIAAVALALIIGGFLVPPTGVIDGSVLTATGELIAIMGVFVFIVRAECGADIIFRKGDMELRMDNEDHHAQEAHEMGAEVSNEDFNV